MKPSRIAVVLTTLVAVAIAGMPSGCGSNAITNAILGNRSNTSDVVGQMLAGDLADAFVRFRNDLTGQSDPNAASALTDAQRTAIENLRGQLTAGQITPQEFAAGVWNVIGDSVPGAALAGMNALGAPLGIASAGNLADVLGLSPQQRTKASDISQKLSNGLDGLQQDAQTQIMSLLTPQQLAGLTQLGGLTSSQPSSQPSTGDEDRPGWKRQLLVMAFDSLTSNLNLNATQKAGIALVRAYLVSGAKGLHQAARDEFTQMLTGGQANILAALEGK